MAGNSAGKAVCGLKRRSPGVQARASGVVNFEVNHMSNTSTAASNVIPFKFGKQQVRTLLIDDQPWFVAADVSSALEYRIAGDMTRNLDEDEKGTQIVRTPGGDQEMLVINESGLYSAILRSRKAEAKRFKKWVTAEVLPAIRKHGLYEDTQSVMAPMIDDLLGKVGALRLGNVMRCRVAKLDTEHQRSATAKLASAVHACFGVPRIELIPASQFEAAANFVASYAIEGEYIAAPKNDGIYLNQYETQHLYLLMSHFKCMHQHKTQMLSAAQALGSSLLMDFFDQLHDGHGSFATLDKRRDEIYGAYKASGLQGGYLWRAA